MRYDCRGLARRIALIVMAGLLLATATGATPSAAEGFTGGLERVEPVGDAPIDPSSGHDHSLHDHTDDLPGVGPGLTASGSPQPTFGANRTQPVVLLNGYLANGFIEWDDGKDVNGEFANIIGALQGWGWSGQVGGAAFYNCDYNYTWNTEAHGKPNVSDKHNYALGGRSRAVNHQGGDCGPFEAEATSHTQETSIEHLAYHWAWMLRDTFGTQCVNAVGHSMGALVIRYALARIATPSDTDFPHDVCVDDVISLGGVHSGSPNADSCFSYQCLQMRSGSNFLTWLGQNARNPQGAGGTDWTNMGSTGDSSAAPPGSTNGNMDPAHAVVYEESIAHTGTLPQDTLYWKNATASDVTANIRWRDSALGFEATTQDGPWPIRHADMSMAYNQWGCGVGNTTSAFPLKNGVSTVGEPYTTSFDCWYWIDVNPSMRQLTVKMSSLNSKDMDLYLYPGSPTAAAGCVSATSASTETCTVNNAASGKWYIRVRNFAQTRDPFTVQATYQNDCATGVDAGASHASATTMSVPVSNCNGFLAPPLDGEDWYKFPAVTGQTITSIVRITSPYTADFNLCLYKPGGSLVACSSNGAGQDERLDFTADVNGDWRVRVISNEGKYVDTYNLSVFLETAQNDCLMGDDAGDSVWDAMAITLPKSNCPGTLLSANNEYDLNDYYKFPVTSGQTINASMTPNPSSNYDICLYSPAGSQIGSCTSGGVGVTESLSHVATQSGDYRLRVTRTSGTDWYTMSVSTVQAQNDCGTGGDAGNSHAGASLITLPKSNCTGQLPDGSDTQDFYKFSITNGQTINASMTPSGAWDFDLCLYNPIGEVVDCSAASGNNTDSINVVANSSGDWRLQVYVFNGSGGYTMSASTTSGPVTIRRDDTTREASSPFNFNDDTAVKRLPVTTGDLSGRTTATLYVFGQADGCAGAPSGNKFRLWAGSNNVAEFNPCNEWSTSSFSWKAFNVPISYISAGTMSFSLEHISGSGDWSSRNVYLAVDSNGTDYGLSDISYDSNTVNGELMWYLVLS